jgi:hypothetical protein
VGVVETGAAAVGGNGIAATDALTEVVVEVW